VGVAMFRNVTTFIAVDFVLPNHALTLMENVFMKDKLKYIRKTPRIALGV
jgi:hypothetical protein